MFQARFIVVAPTKWNSMPALRLEVHGCASSGPPANMGTNVTKDITVTALSKLMISIDSLEGFTFCYYGR